MNPLLAQLSHIPFPEMADALRSTADRITTDWDAAVREAMPQMRHLTVDELKDSTPAILAAIADALASDDPEQVRELVRRSPDQGRSRLLLNFDVVEVMQEDRLLRAVTVRHIEGRMGRRMDTDESAALHAAVDLMLQRSVIALVDAQKTQLRAAAEAELKFLSFLSHDLNANLNGVTLSLQVLGRQLAAAGAGFADAVETLDMAEQAILETVRGMRRLLDHERLRQAGEGPKRVAVDVRAVAARVAAAALGGAQAKGVAIVVDVPPGTVLDTDGELVGLVLQNLVGNAVKYSGRGVVRVVTGVTAGRRSVWVSDQGPGISTAQIGRIFDAFRRGEVHGQDGVGLGLAIASQGARLLGAELTVESAVGVGSTFRLTFPPEAVRASVGEVH